MQSERDVFFVSIALIFIHVIEAYSSFAILWHNSRQWRIEMPFVRYRELRDVRQFYNNPDGYVLKDEHFSFSISRWWIIGKKNRKTDNAAWEYLLDPEDIEYLKKDLCNIFANYFDPDGQTVYLVVARTRK